MHIVPPAPDIADRVEVSFECPAGHEFTRVFAADITAPASWDCPRCGKTATSHAQTVDDPTGHVGKSHWNMVLERRSFAELEEMLVERVSELRTR